LGCAKKTKNATFLEVINILFGIVCVVWIFRKWDVGVWTGSSWLRIGTGGRYL